MNNPTLAHFCEGMIRRADIEESKSNVAMNAWLPQASYPYGNFSDTSTCNFRKREGSIGQNFFARIRTENQRHASFSPFSLHEISVLIELTLGHLRYFLTDVPPQPNSPPDNVFCTSHPEKPPGLILKSGQAKMKSHRISKSTLKVEVFQDCLRSFLCYTP